MRDVVRSPQTAAGTPHVPAVEPTDEVPEQQSFRFLDRATNAAIGQLTLGLSPMALSLAFTDWALHLAASPGKNAELVVKAWRKAARLAIYAARSVRDPSTPPCIEPLLHDNRFRAPGWQKFPYNLIYQNFLLTQQWWHNATYDVAGVSPHHRDVVAFAARQWLDMMSPSNLPWTNPEVIERAVATGGANFAAGFRNWLEDVGRTVARKPPVGTENFQVGRDVAVTPGKVVFRNRLIELIQYSPQTETVYAEPILIVPAWIMKYYILDLSPNNSLIRNLVAHGHTVFCISWRNVDARDSDLSFEDYRRLGVMEALDAVTKIVPERKVHAVGYCLGGTLLAVAAAAMAEFDDERLKTVSLFAAQTDFTEPGELQLFIDDSQVAFLEDSMWQNGTLDSSRMAGAFQLLRSNDLIWSRVVHDYLMGERTPMIDLMAWNADATRMPYHMHSDYLRRFFLANDFASGRYVVDGHPIALQNVRVPFFCVATEQDHVAPWRSVYKIHYLTDSEVTFALTSGGHNAGIVNPPGHPHRHYRIALRHADDLVLGAEEWEAQAPVQDGSWWPAWFNWLAEHSSAAKVAPPAMGAPDKGYPPLAEAPGVYVFQP